MTTGDLRAEIGRLTAERLEAVEAGLGGNRTFMAQIVLEIEAHKAAYIGAVVTEIAGLRGQLSGRLEG